MDLRPQREARGFTLRALADTTGIDKSALSRIENGQREPTPGEARLIQVALGETELVSEGLVSETEAPAETRLDSYPAAPTDPAARREWFNRRNARLQEKGVPAPKSGTFGKAPKSSD